MPGVHRFLRNIAVESIGGQSKRPALWQPRFLPTPGNSLDQQGDVPTGWQDKGLTPNPSSARYLCCAKHSMICSNGLH